MASVALVRAGFLDGLELTRMQLARALRNEIARNKVVIDFPVERTPRKWLVGDLVCFVRSFRTINGYVAVPETHPWYKIHYTECPFKCGEPWCDHQPGSVIEVHGGITFSGLAAEGWVFGFDTAHFDDYVPWLQALLPPELRDAPWEMNHWDVKKVADETTRMAEQLEKVRKLLHAS